MRRNSASRPKRSRGERPHVEASRGQKKQRTGPPGVHLAANTRKACHMLCDPWDMEAQDAVIPVAPICETSSYTTRFRRVIAVGAGQALQVIWCPEAMAANNVHSVGYGLGAGTLDWVAMSGAGLTFPASGPYTWQAYEGDTSQGAQHLQASKFRVGGAAGMMRWIGERRLTSSRFRGVGWDETRRSTLATQCNGGGTPPTATNVEALFDASRYQLARDVQPGEEFVMTRQWKSDPDDTFKQLLEPVTVNAIPRVVDADTEVGDTIPYFDVESTPYMGMLVGPFSSAGEVEVDIITTFQRQIIGNDAGTPKVCVPDILGWNAVVACHSDCQRKRAVQEHVPTAPSLGTKVMSSLTAFAREHFSTLGPMLLKGAASLLM